MALLELVNLKKSYRIGNQSIGVLHGIDLTFDKGEFISILGESGCGKSTLMNLIGGLDSKFEGNILVSGKDIRKFKEKELDDYRKSKIGFIFQSFNLIPHLSVMENVELAMTMSNATRKERNEKAKRLLTELGLENHLYKKSNQLSGGQKQRVAIARALANDPDIILADEPTGSLDSKTAEQILEILKQIASQGKLVIAVTHSTRVAENGTRIIKMADGMIIDDIKLKDNYKPDEENANIQLKSLHLFEAIKLAFNNVKLNLRRNILVALGMSVGIFSMVLMLSLGNGVENFIRHEIESSLDPLTVEVTKKVSDDNKGMGENITSTDNNFNASEIDYLSKIKGVKNVSYVASYIMKVSLAYESKPYMPLIFSTMDGSLKETNMKYGHLPQTGIVISESLANQIAKKNIKSLINKDILMQIPITKNDGTLTYLNKKIIIDGISKKDAAGMGDTTAAYIEYMTLDNIYKENGDILKPTMVKLKALNEKNVDKIKSDLAKNGYEGSRQEKMLEQVTKYLNIAIVILTCIAGISLIVSGIMILTVLYISVVERTREIGILRAIGARKKDIRRIFFVEATMLGLLGGLFGVTFAGIVTIIGNRILIHFFEYSFISLTIYYAIFGIAISTFVSIIAGLMPANKAANSDPVESLRHE